MADIQSKDQNSDFLPDVQHTMCIEKIWRDGNEIQDAMKITAKTISAVLLSTLLLGMLIGSALTWKCGKQREVRVEVGNPLIALQFDQMLNTVIKTRMDLQDFYKTWKFKTAQDETIYIDSTTPWADVPVIDVDFDTAFAIKVDGRPLSIGVHGILTVKGLPISLILRPHKTSYSVVIPDKTPWVDLYATAGLVVSTQLRPLTEIELGVVFWQKAVVFGRLTAGESPIEFKPYAGIKWILF